MKRDFKQNSWDQTIEDDLRQLMHIAVSEDLGIAGDLTSNALIPKGMLGRASVYVRKPGVISGLAALPICLATVDPGLKWFSSCKDGQFVEAGTKLGEIVGPVLGIMTAERLILNLLGHLCGISTLTRKFVDRVEGTKARIYDTRKTTLGWRKLDKYAVHCGGGFNHRTGLYDAVLIKDNHLAFGALPGNVLDSDHSEDIAAKSEIADSGIFCMDHRTAAFSPAEAVRRARSFLTQLLERQKISGTSNLLPMNEIPIIEIEVDNLDHFEDVLAAKPDIILLDNMGPDSLLDAIKRRNMMESETELEASGGITLETVLQVAETGVERISVGSLTHSNSSLDLGLDWEG